MSAGNDGDGECGDFPFLPTADEKTGERFTRAALPVSGPILYPRTGAHRRYARYLWPRGSSEEANTEPSPTSGNDQYPIDHVHPDDRPVASLALSRAFRNGVPQIIFCRQLQEDGSYALAEFRAEPGYDIAVPVQPMVQRPDERWTAVEDMG